jgi:thioredoxin-related protein
MRTFGISLLVIVFGCLSACVEKPDFDQFDDIDAIPTVDASLIYVESPERIINQAGGITFYSQDFIFDPFNEDFIQERLVDAIIRYELDNTTSKPLDFTVELLDAADTVLDTENFMIPAAPTPILIREVTYGPGGRPLDILQNTVTLRLSASNLGDNSSVSSLPDPKIIIRSSARFRLRLK